MDGFPWDLVLAILGVAIPVVAGGWEFALAGRKRLGYRVQMDTTATDAAHSPYAGVLQQMQRDRTPLTDPSLVLLRIQNSGWTLIDAGDYVVRDDDQVGVRVSFPGRRVVGMVVTELSHDYLAPCFEGAAGLRTSDGLIELPRVPLNRRAHYKVLAVLERDPEFSAGQEFPAPVVVAGVKGGVRGGRIRRTESHSFASRPVLTFLAVLVLLVAGQSFATFARSDEQAAPLDCSTGTLHLHGSTAFREAVQEAASKYEDTCRADHVGIAAGDELFTGSADGLDSLAAAGARIRGTDGHGLGDQLSFSDGPKSDGRPQLLPRPIALLLFTLVVNKDAGVSDLSLKQVRQIYSGEITNWKEVKGNDVPIRLISRNPGSGTRTALVGQVLDGRELPQVTVGDCAALDPHKPGRCEVRETTTLLDKVAATPGALGHSEAGNATAHDDLVQVRIDGFPATLEGAEEGAYPYWQTEFAYTYGEPPADSVAAGLLRYLSNEVGKDILRSHGDRPCAELAKPLLCRPT